METSNILIILLFVLPGLLSEQIAQELDYPSKDSNSDFKNTINGIMLSFPILFINGIVFAICYKITTLSSFIDKFDELLFLLQFILSITLTSVIVGYTREHQKKAYEKYINRIRTKRNKMPSSGHNCWYKFLIDKNEYRFLEVIQDGKSHKGFAYEYSTLKEDTSLILEIDKNLYTYDDFDVEKLFNKVIGTYIDIEKNVVIKDYDMSDYLRWYQEKIAEDHATS